MKKVFSIETTTDGRTLLYCSTGEGTGDVETIEMPDSVKRKDCDCRFNLDLDEGLCKKCEGEFYKKTLSTKLI